MSDSIQERGKQVSSQSTLARGVGHSGRLARTADRSRVRRSLLLLARCSKDVGCSGRGEGAGGL